VTIVKRPVTLTIAVALQWLAAVIAVIAGFDLMAAALEMSQAGVATQVEAALVNQGILDVSGEFVVVGVFVAGVLLMAIAFVRVMVAVYLARGRNWARIVVAVLVLISLAGDRRRPRGAVAAVQLAIQRLHRGALVDVSLTMAPDSVRARTPTGSMS
jgi:hypothetical protein